jgi:hypothetical protein
VLIQSPVLPKIIDELNFSKENELYCIELLYW